MEILKKNPLIPLEREYEGWIISQIEDYFLKLGYFFKILAVSPNVENIWPADEIIYLEYEGNLKFFGLQFKRPNLTTSKSDLSKVKWDFSDSRQFHISKIITI